MNQNHLFSAALLVACTEIELPLVDVLLAPLQFAQSVGAFAAFLDLANNGLVTIVFILWACFAFQTSHGGGRALHNLQACFCLGGESQSKHYVAGERHAGKSMHTGFAVELL